MTSKKGLMLVFIAALLLSIGGLCIKQIPWQPLAINSFRSIISVALLLVFAKGIHRKFKLTKGVILGALSVWGASHPIHGGHQADHRRQRGAPAVYRPHVRDPLCVAGV